MQPLVSFLASGFVDKIAEINNAVNGVVWGVPALVLLIGTGILMTILTKFGGIFAGTTANLGGDLLQGCFAIALFVLGVTVAVQGVKKLFGKKETVNA